MREIARGIIVQQVGAEIRVGAIAVDIRGSPTELRRSLVEMSEIGAIKGIKHTLFAACHKIARAGNRAQFLMRQRPCRSSRARSSDMA